MLPSSHGYGPRMTASTTKRYPAPRVSSAEVEEARLVGLSAIVVDVPLYKREGWCVV